MKMSVYTFTAFFYLLLFLLMCVTLCGQLYADAIPSSPKTNNHVELFKTDQPKTVFTPNGSKEEGKKITVENFHSLFLVSTDDVTIAIAGVKSDTYFNNIEILTNYIENKKILGKDVTITESDWKTQFAIKNAVRMSDVGVNSFLAVAKQKNIYLLLVNFKANLVRGSSSTQDFELKLTVGTVNGEGTDKTIMWEDESSVTDIDVVDKIRIKLNSVQSASSTFGGNAFLTHDGEIFFALVISTNMRQRMTALIHLNKQETKQPAFECKKLFEDCYSYIFPWKEKIVMLPITCTEGKEKKIMESSDMGVSWNESKETLFQHYNFLEGKRNFVTVTINAKKVLLFTERKSLFSVRHQTENINLWMSDGTRVGYIGTVVNNVEKAFYESVLQTNNFLSALISNHKNEDADEDLPKIEKIYFTRQEDHLQNITNTLKAWEESDKKVPALCEETNNEQTTDCTTSLPIKGLVGFLRDATDKASSPTIWKDEYYYSNAKVSNGKKVLDGFEFNEARACAIWTVGETQENKRYNFTYPGFTLLANVKIGSGASGKDNSIFGVGLTDNSKNVGLWCTAGNKWGVKVGTGQREVTPSLVACEREKNYYVLLILNGTKIVVYVNGEQLTDLNGVTMKIEKEKIISHFFFGADNEAKSQTPVESHTTITNVLLYNRPFNSDEIEAFKPKQHTEAEKKKQNQNEGGKLPKSEKGANSTESDTSPDTSITKRGEGAQSSLQPPPTTEDSAARVTVDLLCFMLFGVFTLLGRYVY